MFQTKNPETDNLRGPVVTTALIENDVLKKKSFEWNSMLRRIEKRNKLQKTGVLLYIIIEGELMNSSVLEADALCQGAIFQRLPYIYD